MYHLLTCHLCHSAVLFLKDPDVFSSGMNSRYSNGGRSSSSWGRSSSSWGSHSQGGLNYVGCTYKGSKLSFLRGCSFYRKYRYCSKHCYTNNSGNTCLLLVPWSLLCCPVLELQPQTASLQTACVVQSEGIHTAQSACRSENWNHMMEPIIDGSIMTSNH